MRFGDVFLYLDLTPEDQVTFAKAFQVCLKAHGPSKCWRVGAMQHVAFAGFSAVNPKKLTYKNVDARPLILAMANQFQSEECPVAVRRSCCSSRHCLNPAHYYWGTKSDVSFETAKRNGTAVLPQTIEKMRQDKDQGKTHLQISRKYKIPYHIARRICNGEIYENLSNPEDVQNDTEFWRNIVITCTALASYYKSEAKEFNLAYHVSEQLTCPWHRKGSDAHKGNFGLMGECLDCMEEIKAGRCSVDVKNFDFQWYWQVKRFWEQVDVRGTSECWPWLGATRRDNKESIAYFPSPFHSAKTQSAPRVAFWLSRGYTGKYRIFNKPECQAFCCNPTHLTIRELKGSPQPNEITEICLNHGNIFQHYREADPKDQPSPAV